ncbi:APC family permease [Acidobacterium sp. S8]|uniref:APC family permease n=1 Tax=Acidobacterium sp. S8 TaxID=1641854 RepID=UPI00131D87A4|nr:amino acid permease [Acidobacterium sp. S8]
MNGSRLQPVVAASTHHDRLPQLERGVGLWGAISANVLNMVGIGPFLTIPLVLAAMGGPQAMLGWILGALIALCDGLVWAELGSAMPQSGGPYHYLLEAFGPRSFGRMLSFLFLWQTMLVGPLSIASGAVGFTQYAKYLVPSIHGWQFPVLAAVVCLLNTVLLLRRIRTIGGLSVIIAVIVLGTGGWILLSGLLHFHAALAFDFPAHAFVLSHGFFTGLGAATLIALYDYGGYFNVCLIGGEVRDPRRTIPRSILISIGLVAVLYLAMNVSILGVVPWREAMHSDAIVAMFMERIYGVMGARLVSVLILIATFGSVFAVLLGYSRVPYAAAVDGRFFSVFSRLHAKGQYPIIAVWTMGLLSAVACIFSLADLISTLIVVQTMLQFIAQCVAVFLLRKHSRSDPSSYRMPFFPLPAFVALFGWIYIVVTSGARYIEIGALLIVVGIAAFLLRSYRAHEWPFGVA